MKRLREEKGIVLVIALMFLLVLGLLGMSAIISTQYENRISGNKRISEQAFYTAEAGIQEVLGRFRDGATGEIEDTDRNNVNWRCFIALSQEKAVNEGYVPGPNQQFLQSLQTVLDLKTLKMDFVVEISHKLELDSANNKVVKWIEENPVYLVRSLGVTPEGGRKLIETELNPCPSFNPDAALYSERPVYLQATSTYIRGKDGCGPNDAPGVASTLPKADDPVDLGPGSSTPTVEGNPPIQYSTPDRSLAELVDYLRKDANFTQDFPYGSTGETVMTVDWGTPQVPKGSDGTKTPLSYSGPLNIVYYNMLENASGAKGTLKLKGGSCGAGILLVDGNLKLDGGFTWYGLVIVTGYLVSIGGGQKNITGGVMTGESAIIDVDISGNSGIIYCSAIMNLLKGRVTPIRMTRWREVY